MSGKLILQADVERDLDQNEAKKLKDSIERSLKDIALLSAPRVFYQKETGTVSVGAAVDKNLNKLSEDPGAGRYLAIFIISDSGEIISEKFILNPALKEDKGRFGLALTILKRNGVKRILMPDKPESEQQMLLKEISMEHFVAPSLELDVLRSKLPAVLN